MKVALVPLVEFGVVCCRGSTESGLVLALETAGCCAARFNAKLNTKPTFNIAQRWAKLGVSTDLADFLLLARSSHEQVLHPAVSNFRLTGLIAQQRY